VASESDFADLLVDKKFLSASECKLLLSKFKGDLFRLVVHVAEKTPRRKQELGRYWGDYIGFVYLDLSRTIIQYRLLNKLPEEFVRENLIMPVYEFGGTISVVAADPRDEAALHQAESYLDGFLSPAFAFPDQIRAAIEVGFQTESSLTRLLDKTKITAIDRDEGPVSAAELKNMSGDQAIVDFSRGLAILALKQGASDIHIEPGEHTARVRFRIDGVLQEVFHLELGILPPIITRLKVMADMNIAERRKPQDGSLTLELGERQVDCRLSSIPTIYGEKLVLRVLGAMGFESVPVLEVLDFSRRNEDELKKVIASPHGLFFVTGPTGSGKTTTLYSMLQHLNTHNVNIMTIEDPVEFRLPGLNQVQVNTAADVTFASTLRASLRQDPDVILIGEIRDLETARIATRAALTGHLVMTTLHTNSAVQAVTRLLDIGVEPFLVAPSVIGILAQRLVRRLCDKCKREYRLSPEEVREYFEAGEGTEVLFYTPEGCERCNNIGYNGRLAIQEVLMIDDEVRSLISQSAPLHEVRKWAERNEIPTIRYDGVKKVLRGMTTMAEVNRVTLLE
jgi:type IV pilus assembly protein PilB